MATAKELPIKFRIKEIETTQFAEIGLIHNPDNLKYFSDFSYNLFEDERIINCIFKYTLKEDEKPLLIIEVEISFVIEEKSFTKIQLDNQTWLLPKVTAKHFALICVGTARGILHEKTRDSEFNKYPMPTINLEKRITTDVKFE